MRDQMRYAAGAASEAGIALLLAAVLILGAAGAVAARPEQFADNAAGGERLVALHPVADASLDASLPGENICCGETLGVFHHGQGQTGRALLGFDLGAALPPDAVIDSAWLDLYQVAGASQGSVAMKALAVAAAWDEAGVTWRDQPADSGPVAIGAFDAEEGWQSLDVTGLVQETLAQGSPLSIKLAGPEGAADYARAFQSRESRDYAPRLEVDYHVPGQAGHTFSGNVYQGTPPGPGQPLEGVVVELYGAGGAWVEGESGRLLARTTTGPRGEFSLAWTGEHYPYLHVVETDQPGAYSTHAQVDRPGIPAGASVVSFAEVMDGQYGGIAFWDDALPAGCQGLLANGDFESRTLAPWTSEGQAGLGAGRQGEQGAWLGGANAVTGEISQEVTVPEGAGPVVLHFWWLADGASEQPGDVLDVVVRGRVDDRLRSLPAAPPLGEWRPVSLDLSAYAGERVRLSFFAHTDRTGPTTFRVDGAGLSACGTAPPDLVVSDLRRERDRVCYTLENQGNGPAQGGHTTALFVDGVQRAGDEVAADLGPDARRDGCFDYTWQCGESLAQVRAVADYDERIAEASEDNNPWQVVWHCGQPRYASVWPGYPPVIDGQAPSEEWAGAASIPLKHGALLVQNDAANLYLLVDVTADTQQDEDDSLMLTFDANTDSIITPGVDLNFSGGASQPLGSQYYLGPGQWASRATTAFSQMGAAFGSSPNGRTSHRIWELAISLEEIKAAPGGWVRLGLKTVSQAPAIVGENPPGFATSFGDLLGLRLAAADVELLVLAHQDFLGALKPLKEHKDYTGIPTYVQSWQSLDKSFGPSSQDGPERIKRAIAAYEAQANTRWVMLVGDSDRFPVRYLCRDLGPPSGYGPGDLYYADLYRADGTFDDWDGNSNGLYGQIDTTQAANNADLIDWHPDVAVARVPASTAAEVATYVQKIQDYEFAAYGSTWFNRALLVTGCSDCGPAVGVKDEIAQKYLGGYTTIKHYHTAVWPAYPIDKSDIAGSVDKRAAPLTQYLNDGVGFLNYYGHGSTDDFCWVYDSRHLNDLTNSGRLPVLFSRACANGEYAPNPPWQSFRDVSGQYHAGHAPKPGEIVPIPDPIQPGAASANNCDREARPEDWLVKRKTGGIAMVASAGTANPGYDDVLDKDFYRAYSLGIKTFGDMWRYIVQRYLDSYGYFDAQGNNTGYNEWHRKAIWNGLIRYHAFGDPSLRIGGISWVQKADLLGSWSAIPDGLLGSLELRDAAGDHPELKPNLEGIYTGPGGKPHSVLGWMRTWRNPLPQSWGPDHKVEFQVDLAGTSDPKDDQRFEGYLFTRSRDAMAGITWQEDVPFGFYAIKGQSGLATLRPATLRPAPSLEKEDFLGAYRVNLDGEPGGLTLEARPDDDGSEQPNIEGVYIGPAGQAHGVRGYVRTPTYALPKSWGPDHQIVLYVDFEDTPDPDDDQKLDGYLLTETRAGLAGMTWQGDTPYGFYALKLRGIYLPLVTR